MLLQLRISDFAIIDSCLLDFDEGFIALTGETGAGKSIIVDALGAVLGARVGPDVIRSGTKRAEIEAVFEYPHDPSVSATLESAGMVVTEDVLILSREISPGRTIARVNGRAVPVTVLAEIGNRLVDLHGQSEHLSLLKSARQLDMLDHFGRLDQVRTEFAQTAGRLSVAREQYQGLEANRRTAEQRVDLLRFQVQEIESADLRSGEIQELEWERVRLANAEKLAALATEAIAALDGSDADQATAVELTTAAAAAVRQLAAIDNAMDEPQQSLDELRYTLRDLASTIRSYRDTVEFDPARLDLIESRLDQIHRLQRKYGDSVEDVLELLNSARQELEQIENYETRLAEARAEVAALEHRAAREAWELSLARSQVSRRFAAEVHERLATLGLGPALFSIELDHAESADGLSDPDNPHHRVAFTTSGIDRIRFMVAFNTGEPLRPIEKVASGGETARFMLAVKAVLANADDVSTLIFDEIDTGVGGRGGSVVADMLVELAASHQVISITHLPQIAARAAEHLKVTKAEDGGVTKTAVVRLEGQSRVMELAEMLSGSPPPESAVQAAHDLMASGTG